MWRSVARAEITDARADVRVVDVAIDHVGSQLIAVEVPAPGVGPAAQLHQRHLLMQLQGLIRREANLPISHALQEALVKGVCSGFVGDRLMLQLGHERG